MFVGATFVLVVVFVVVVLTDFLLVVAVPRVVCLTVVLGVVAAVPIFRVVLGCDFGVRSVLEIATGDFDSMDVVLISVLVCIVALPYVAATLPRLGKGAKRCPKVNCIGTFGDVMIDFGDAVFLLHLLGRPIAVLLVPRGTAGRCR